MDPPKSKTTIRISTNIGTASQYADSSMTVIELVGRTPQEKGQHYLQLSLTALEELADLLEDRRLPESEKAAYNDAYDSGMAQYDDMVQLRNQLLARKKSFRNFLVNLFVRQSEASRFYKITYRNYSAIRRTSEELHRRLMPVRKAVPSSLTGSFEGPTQSNVSVCEESPRDVVESNVLVKNLPPNETLRGITLEVQTEQEENQAFETLGRIAKLSGKREEEEEEEEDDDDDDDDDRTIRASTSQSRPPSPAPSCTVIYNINNINSSVLSFDSEVTGASIHSGVTEGSPTNHQ